ncbi:AcrR family transcriptional regulator [Bradyrhizobium sp. i1.3.1]
MHLSRPTSGRRRHSGAATRPPSQASPDLLPAMSRAMPPHLIIDYSFQNNYCRVMARTKEFDQDEALDAAIGAFREHGFEGTSTPMLVDAMGIGRQSIYDTFGDKWQLYCAAVRRYAASEVEAHLAALRAPPRAIDGLRAMIDRVVRDANEACLGIGSISEFGRSRDDLTSIHAASGRALQGRRFETLARSAGRRRRDAGSRRRRRSRVSAGECCRYSNRRARWRQAAPITGARRHRIARPRVIFFGQIWNDGSK